MMIPKGGKYAKSVVNALHKAPKNWEKFKAAIQQIENFLKNNKLKLDGKQKTIFESNKNILENHERIVGSIDVKLGGNIPNKRGEARWIINELRRRGDMNLPADKAELWKNNRIDPLVLFEEYLGTAATKKLPGEGEVSSAKKYLKYLDEAKDIAGKGITHPDFQRETIFQTKGGEDFTKLSLSQLNKKSHDLQKRIREIIDNPDIKGTVTEGPKSDLINAMYESENAVLTNARHIIKRNNNLKKYGNIFPRLDPENNAFIILRLDETGAPVKIGRFTGKFSGTKDKTGDLTRKEGTSYYDKWNSETGKLREEGKEIFHETLDSEGKVIMSNPEYKLPKIQNMELQNELYTNLSTSDLAAKGFKLKEIDMIRKARLAKDYLTKTRSKDRNIAMHEQTSESEVMNVMEDLYHRGDDVYKMSIEEWITKIPEHFAEGGRTGFHQGSLRHQKEHDYQAYEDEGNFMKYLKLSGDRAKMSSPENWVNRLFNLSTEEPARDDFETMMKERFMYGEHIPPNVFKQVVLDFKEVYKKLKGSKKRKEHATGGISNLFQERQGFRSGKAVELVTKLPEFLKFVEGLLIKASNEIRQGIGKWKGLNDAQRVTQNDNLTKLATEFQKTKKFDVRINEYTGIDAEKAFVEAQAKVKAKGKIWKSSEGETQGIAMGFDEEGIKALDYAMKKGTALSDAMKKMGFDVASMKDTLKFDKLVSEGMIGFSRELKEQIIRAKYGDVVNKELLNQLLTDSNPQRLSEVMGTIDEGVIMHEKGMGTDEIITTLKESFKRKPNVEGGLILGFATGGVSNLFRRR